MDETPEVPSAAEIDTIRQTVAKIGPLLAGLPPMIQGAVLADLTAFWLAGHCVDGPPAATRQFRKELFDLHFRAIWEFVEVNAKTLGTDR